MRLIEDKEISSFVHHIEQTKDDSIYLINITNVSTYHIVIGRLKKVDNTLQVNFFNRGEGWRLINLDSIPLDDVVEYEVIKYSNAVQTAYEANSLDRNKYNSAIHCLCHVADSVVFPIQVTRQEFSQLYKLLKNGYYLVHLVNREVFS